MSPIKPTTRRLPLAAPLPVVTLLRLLLLLRLLTCELHSFAFAQHVDSFDQGARRFSLWRDDARTVMRSIQQPNPTPAEPGVEQEHGTDRQCTHAVERRLLLHTATQPGSLLRHPLTTH